MFFKQSSKTVIFLFVFLLLFIFSNNHLGKIYAACSSYQVPNSGLNRKGFCSVSNNLALDCPPITLGAWCSQYVCDTNSEAQAICAGGSPSCTPGSCTGCGDPATCNDFNNDQFACQARGGCNWDANRNPNHCEGQYCRQNCYDKSNDQSGCQGIPNCTWTSTAGQCAFPCNLPVGQTCGTKYCNDSCGASLVCGSAACSSPTCSISFSPPSPGNVNNTINILPSGSYSGGLGAVNTYVNKRADGVYDNSQWEIISSNPVGGVPSWSGTVPWTTGYVSYTVGTHVVAVNLYNNIGSFLTQCTASYVLNNPACTINSFTASPNPVNFNTAANLSWSTSDATGCTLNGSGVAVNGSTSTGPLTTGTPYTLACTGTGGNCSQSLTVNVNAAPAQYPVCDWITVNPSSGTSPLTVTVTGISGHTVNGGSIAGYRYDYGAGLTSSTSYTYNSAGSYNVWGYAVDNLGNISSQTPSCQWGVVVGQNTCTTNLSASPTSVAYNGASDISWSSTNAASCTISPPGWTGTNNTGRNTGALTATQTYDLTCTAVAGATACPPRSVTVTVGALPVCVIPTPTDPPAPACVPTAGGTSSVTWSWAPVGNGADQYQIVVTDDATGATVSDSGWRSASSLNCGSGTCQYVTVTLSPGTYQSQVRSGSTAGACATSAWSSQAFATVSYCTPTCSVSGSVLILDPGGSPQNFTVNYTVTSGTVLQISWAAQLPNPAGLTISPPSRTPPNQCNSMSGSCTTTVAAANPGTSGTIVTTVALQDAGGSPSGSCTTTTPVNVNSYPAWWQSLGGGDVFGVGAVQSLIPGTCTGTCQPYIIRN